MATGVKIFFCYEVIKIVSYDISINFFRPLVIKIIALRINYKIDGCQSQWGVRLTKKNVKKKQTDLFPFSLFSLYLKRDLIKISVV